MGGRAGSAVIRNDRIVYVREPYCAAPCRQARTSEIIVSDLDGTGSHVLATGGLPGVSPDGRLIAFVQEHGRNGVVVSVMNADGTEIRPVLECSFCDVQGAPTWSPDGASVAVGTGYRPASPGEKPPVSRIDVVDVVTGDARTVFRCVRPRCSSLFDPSWSPDGTGIVFWAVVLRDVDPPISSNTYVGELQRIDLSTGAVYTIHRCSECSGSSGLDWSPDGRNLVFAGGEGLMGISASGGEPWHITTVEEDILPAWSPDGRLIAFARADLFRPDIYVVEPDGTVLRPVTAADGEELFSEYWPSWGTGRR